MDKKIEKFRNYLRLQATSSAVKDTYTTFASHTASSIPDTLTFKRKN